MFECVFSIKDHWPSFTKNLVLGMLGEIILYVLNIITKSNHSKRQRSHLSKKHLWCMFMNENLEEVGKTFDFAVSSCLDQ